MRQVDALFLQRAAAAAVEFLNLHRVASPVLRAAERVEVELLLVDRGLDELRRLYLLFFFHVVVQVDVRRLFLLFEHISRISAPVPALG